MRRSSTGVCLALLGVLATDVSATTVRRLTDEALTEQAETIVIGRAVERQARWVDRDLVTFVTIQVTETLKGTVAPTVTVAVPGGIDARGKFKVAVTYPGAPTIGPDEEVVLFLVEGQEISGAYAVAGFSQGKYSVLEGPSGEKEVTRDLTGVTVADPGGVTRGTQTRRRLADLRDDIRRYLSVKGEAR